MNLHFYLSSLPKPERQIFAAKCGSPFGRLMQIAYGNEPARAELCVAIDRETNGFVWCREVNCAWNSKNGVTDKRKRIFMDWAYLEEKCIRYKYGSSSVEA
jgi:hypothetical protein